MQSSRHLMRIRSLGVAAAFLSAILLLLTGCESGTGDSKSPSTASSIVTGDNLPSADKVVMIRDLIGKNLNEINSLLGQPDGPKHDYPKIFPTDITPAFNNSTPTGRSLLSEEEAWIAVAVCGREPNGLTVAVVYRPFATEERIAAGAAGEYNNLFDCPDPKGGKVYVPK